MQDLNRCIDKIELVDYHQVLEHEGIKFWCYNAGHVLGAAMFMIEIAVSWWCAGAVKKGSVFALPVPAMILVDQTEIDRTIHRDLTCLAFSPP